MSSPRTEGRFTDSPVLTALLLVAAAVAVLLLEMPGVFLRGEVATGATLAAGRYTWVAGASPDLLEAPRNPVLSDDLYLFKPWQNLTARTRTEGLLPLWNPHAACGAPLLANHQSALLAPTALPGALWPTPRGHTCAAFLRAVLACLFAGLLARDLGLGRAGSILAGVAYGFGSTITVWLLYPLSGTAALLPLVILAMRRCLKPPGWWGAVLLAVAVTATLLAGHLPTSLHVLGAGVLYGLAVLVLEVPWGQRRTALTRASLALLAGLLLSAPQTLPLAEYLGQGEALRGRAKAEHGARHLPVEAGLTWTLPRAFGSPERAGYRGPVNFNEAVAYVGLAPLLLSGVALATWRRRTGLVVLVLLGLAGAGVAYGLPPFADTAARLPGLAVTANQRLVLLTQLAMVLLGARGLRVLLDGATGRRAAATGGLVAGALVLAGQIGAAFHAHRLGTGPEALAELRLALPLLAGTLLMMIALLWRPPRIPAALPAAGLVLLLLLDLAGFGRGFHPTVRPQVLFPETPALRFLASATVDPEGQRWRIATFGRILHPNLPTLVGLDDVRGRDAIDMAGPAALLRRAPGEVGAPEDPMGAGWDRSLRVLGLMNARFLLTEPCPGTPTGPGNPRCREENLDPARVVYAGPDARILENPYALSRAAWYGQAEPIATGTVRGSAGLERDLDRVLDPQRDPRGALLVETGIDLVDTSSRETDWSSPETLFGGTATSHPTRLLDYGPESLTVEVDAPEAGWLLVRDAFYPGWRATVDGAPAEVVRAEAVFRAVAVPAGRHRVEMAYRPPSFQLGLGLACLGLIVLAGLVIATLRSTRAGNTA